MFDREGESPMFYAAKFGRQDSLRAFADHGVSAREDDIRGYISLFHQSSLPRTCCSFVGDASHEPLLFIRSILTAAINAEKLEVSELIIDLWPSLCEDSLRRHETNEQLSPSICFQNDEGVEEEFGFGCGEI